MIILRSFLPQSACSEPAVFCTGLGLPGFCNHVQPVQLSALLQPKIGQTGGHKVDPKGYKPQKNPQSCTCQQNLQAIYGCTLATVVA